MNVDSERQLRQVYTVVVKRVLKDCASEDVHLPESLIRELEARWIERYASKSNTRLSMEECDCVQEPSTQEVFTPPVSLYCTAHTQNNDSSDTGALLPVILRCNVNHLNIPGILMNRCPELFPVGTFPSGNV